MRYFWLIIVVFCLGCSDEIELFSPYQELPVIYGIWDLTDEEHYVSLQRVFQSETNSIRQAARNPDSIYYPDAKVEITNLSNGNVYEFNSSTIAPRDTGIFLSDPNLVYIAPPNFNLVAENTYEVKAFNQEKLLASAQSVILGKFTITKPRVNEKISLNRPKVSLRWLQGEGIAIYEVFWKINLIQKSGENIKEITLTWPLGVVEDNTQISFAGEELFQFLQSQLEGSEDITYQFKDMDLLVIGGSNEYREYRSSILANEGLTSAVLTTVFSNIQGGFGLFTSSTTSIVPRIRLTDESLDSLRNGRFTKELNFQ